MKIITKEESDTQMRATAVGGAKGFAGGLAVALPMSYLLNKRWGYYRALPPSLKAFGVIIVAVPAFVINAEHSGLRYEKERRTDFGKLEMDAKEAVRQAKWDRMTVTQKFQDVAARHEYGFIGGAWATSMIGAFGYIMRNPYETLPQKLVQARMWAQGLTIGVLIAAAVLTHSRKMKSMDEYGHRLVEPDHSWRDIIEQEERNAHAKPGSER
ncbi:uncharacterized protein LAESUDRAFT_718871 [Laetiporus sulphureus 93-53]|uniref:HIG1 domain-containing protein n=1 Tax=Laetiporus sulphureus 93-53 TaxID=1314785 RepID=A0A165I4T1_9APHY|nr:uncharacterized protein LAESUDRAFT_718871 [Laetiporus sulphureus 93-53]KZT12594.1 hypothetical protein LAESUDRAFT_718871 [Laetiporus sulphureus 93-53]